MICQDTFQHYLSGTRDILCHLLLLFHPTAPWFVLNKVSDGFRIVADSLTAVVKCMWDVLLPAVHCTGVLAKRISDKLRGYLWETTSMENCTLSAERRGLKRGFVTRWSLVFPAPAVSFVRGREWAREMLNRLQSWKHPLSGCDAEDYQHVQWTHTTSLSRSYLNLL